MKKKSFKAGKKITLILILYSLCLKTQSIENNFIRISYDCIEKKVRDIKFFRDSLMVWNFNIYENELIQLNYLHVYDVENKITNINTFKNSKLLKIDSISSGNGGQFYKLVVVGEYDNCMGVDCTLDKYGRLIEIKSYRYNKRRGRKTLESWSKFYYVSNLNYNQIFDSLTN